MSEKLYTVRTDSMDIERNPDDDHLYTRDAAKRLMVPVLADFIKKEGLQWPVTLDVWGGLDGRGKTVSIDSISDAERLLDEGYENLEVVHNGWRAVIAMMEPVIHR